MYQAIRLAPQMDSDTMVRVLNQNFATIENYTDYYKVVGVEEFPEVTGVGSYATVTQNIEITHNSNANVRFKVFAEAYPFTNGGILTPLNDSVVPIFWNTSVIANLPSSTTISMGYYAALDKDKLYIFRECLNASAGARTVPSGKIYYFVEREPI